MSNGREWIIMPLPMKTAYIRGALDSLLLCVPELDWSKPTVPGVVALWQAEISTDEYRESLDGFYSDPSNRPVPIVHAMTWTRMRANGASETKLKEYKDIWLGASEERK